MNGCSPLVLVLLSVLLVTEAVRAPACSLSAGVHAQSVARVNLETRRSR